MSSKPEKTAYQSLTPKQKAFVNAICADPNISATEAARAAGCKEAGVRVTAHRMLTNANVRKAFAEKLKDVGPSTEEIAHRWDRVSRATLDDFYTEEEYEEQTQEQRPLLEKIAELEYEINFEERVAKRQVLDEDEQEKHYYRQQRRRNEVIRAQVELEMNPAATYTVAGTPIKKKRLVLDLVKAQQLGVLDLAKAIKPTQYGLGLELRDPDAALDKLARIKGAYEKDNEQARAVTVLNTKTEIITTGPPIARSEKDIDDV